MQRGDAQMVLASTAVAPAQEQQRHDAARGARARRARRLGGAASGAVRELRRPRRHRRVLLPHGADRRLHAAGRAVVRRRPRVAAAPRGGDGRGGRAARRDRPRGRRARRLRQVGELARTPGEPLAQPARRATGSSRATPGRSSRTSTASASGSRTTGPPTCHIGIIHGDYQFANVMFSHHGAEARGDRRLGALHPRRPAARPGVDAHRLARARRPARSRRAAAVRSGTACRAARTSSTTTAR